MLAAHVRGHNDDAVFEIHGAAVGVGEPTIIHDLQKDAEHIVVRLFDLIKQDHRIGLAAHRLGELASFFIAHVSRRRPD